VGAVRALLDWLLRRPAESPEHALGRRGERHAAGLLKRAGYRILGRNVRVKVGEADLVCLDPDGETVVIVEVKTRAPSAAASPQGAAVPPEASVHQWKRRKLLAVAQSLARANGWERRPLRIDIIAIDWPDDGRDPVVRHFVSAVTGR
jgi:putative endonuclease